MKAWILNKKISHMNYMVSFKPIYQHIAMVTHSGSSSHAGHYYTYALDNITNNSEDSKWVNFNDSVISENLKFDLNGTKNDTPYILFYKQKVYPSATSSHPASAVSLLDASNKLLIPESLKPQIQIDNENYLKEIEERKKYLKQQQYTNDYINSQWLSDFLKSLKNNANIGFDKARTMYYDQDNGFDRFGGGGGIC